MKLILNNLGKRYHHSWIFRHLNTTIGQGERWVILGSNGSGKSTLLKAIAAWTNPSEGRVEYYHDGLYAEPDGIWSMVSLAAPYLELIEEFTWQEMIRFHYSLRALVPGLKPDDVASLSGLETSVGKPLRQFSSGMKQRARLSLALFSQSPLLLLDEPCSNLDSQGIEWYKNMINQYAGNRTILVCSNDQPEEFFFCDHRLKISEFRG